MGLLHFVPLVMRSRTGKGADSWDVNDLAGTHLCSPNPSRHSQPPWEGPPCSDGEVMPRASEANALILLFRRRASLLQASSWEQ